MLSSARCVPPPICCLWSLTHLLHTQRHRDRDRDRDRDRRRHRHMLLQHNLSSHSVGTPPHALLCRVSTSTLFEWRTLEHLVLPSRCVAECTKHPCRWCTCLSVLCQQRCARNNMLRFMLRSHHTPCCLAYRMVHTPLQHGTSWYVHTLTNHSFYNDATIAGRASWN
jgi:hypothetical protein